MYLYGVLLTILYKQLFQRCLRASRDRQSYSLAENVYYTTYNHYTRYTMWSDM